MANLLAETHEDGLFVPNWGTIGTTSPTRSVIVPNPFGTGKVMKIAGQTTGPRQFPYIDLPAAKYELYGSFRWRWGQTLPSGVRSSVGPNVFDYVVIGGRPFGQGQGGNAFFSVNLFGPEQAMAGLRMSIGDMFYDGSGGSGERFTMVMSNVLTKTDWHTIDWHISIGATTQRGLHGSTGAPIFGAPVTGRLRVDCGAIDTASGTAHAYNFQPINIGALWIPDSTGAFEHYLDDVAVNDTAGSIDSTWICGSTFPGGGITSIPLGEGEIEIEIPWFRPKKLQIPRTGDFAADDDAHRLNERARQHWHDDPIEDFGTIVERQREE